MGGARGMVGSWRDGCRRGLIGMDSCFRRNDGGGWLGVGEMDGGTGCAVWIPAYAGMTGRVGWELEGWLQARVDWNGFLPTQE